MIQSVHFRQHAWAPKLWFCAIDGLGLGLVHEIGTPNFVRINPILPSMSKMTAQHLLLIYAY